MCNTSLFVSHQYSLLVYHLGAQDPAHYFQTCKGTEVQIDDSQTGAYLPLKHIHVQSADQVIFFSCMLCFPRLGRRTLQLSWHLRRSGHMQSKLNARARFLLLRMMRLVCLVESVESVSPEHAVKCQAWPEQKLWLGGVIRSVTKTKQPTISHQGFDQSRMIGLSELPGVCAVDAVIERSKNGLMASVMNCPFDARGLLSFQCHFGTSRADFSERHGSYHPVQVTSDLKPSNQQHLECYILRRASYGGEN